MLDLEEYKASSIQSFVSFGNMIIALPKPSIKFDEPDMVLTLALHNFKIWNIFNQLNVNLITCIS